MIIKAKISAFQYITSKKTGQEYLKVWVKVPATDNCIGDPVESCVVPVHPGISVDVGKECIVSVDGFGRLHDIQL